MQHSVALCCILWAPSPEEVLVESIAHHQTASKARIEHQIIVVVDRVALTANSSSCVQYWLGD
jgi:hypothetical protein